MNETATSTARWINEIRDVLSTIDGWDLDESHRKTVHRCLMAEMLAASDRYDDIEETARSGKRWSDDDVSTLGATLVGRVATTWELERMNVMEAALRLKRSEKSVKKKAIELGFSQAVDYWAQSER